MAQGGQVFVNFGANTQGLLTGTARAGNILQRFSQTGVGAAIVLGASFVTLSRTMTNFVSSTVSGFKEFDYQIVRAKALAGATTEEYNKMSDVATELGRTTEWMAKDVAAGMSNLALAGFKANEIIEMIPESLRLATAGGVNLSKTNTIMANAMRSFNLEADQANQVSNVLTATFTTANTTLESLAQTIKNAAGVLSTVGVKIEEVSAAAGVLGDIGILASVAGTGLKNYGIKLAKTFGIMKDATKSAKEYFEALGVTKDRLFDAETGTFDMVEATIAFKEAMDKLGKAKAPEFLAQFSTLFGERAAVSLTALVRKAEQFKIQSQNVRMTEMIGDVQQVFEQIKALGNETVYMNNIQEGLNNAIKDMVNSLSDADVYMEEFTDSGEGAVGVITRLSRSFKSTQKILEDTFGKDSFSITDGLIAINEYGKESAVSMVRLDAVLKELEKTDIGKKRREELEEERKRLEELIVTSKKDISQLTDQGRARLINFTALRKYLDGLKESNDGTSKEVNQIQALNDVFKGNAQNVAMAARAFGIHISANEKLSPSLQSVSKEMEKLSSTTEAEKYYMKRMTSQIANTNTAMDMQVMQLETLDGVMKIFQSGIELVSNKIAKALSPALTAVIQSATSFMRVLTLSNNEIDRGVTASDKLRDSWRETLKIFTDGEGIFSRITKGFEGLSSIGKTLALVMGSLGAAGLATGGAFIWVQALLPALSALATTFLTIVVPVGALAAAAIGLSLSFKKAHDQSKLLGDVSNKSIEEIMTSYNGAEGVVKGFTSKINELDAQMIKTWSNFKESFKNIGLQFSNIMNPLEKIAGLTNTINITGSRLTIFSTNDKGVTVIKDTLKTINGLMEKTGNISEAQKEKIRAAIKAGDATLVNKLLQETPSLLDDITAASMRMTIFRKDQDIKSEKFQKDLREMKIVLNGLSLDANNSGESIRKALSFENITILNNKLSKTPLLLQQIKDIGVDTTLFDYNQNKNIANINNEIIKFKDKISSITGIANADRIALEKAFRTKNIEEINSLLNKTPELLNKVREAGINVDLFDSNINTNLNSINNAFKIIQNRLEGIKNISKEDKEALMKAFKTNNIQEVNNILSKNKELLGIIARENLRIGFATEVQQARYKDLNSLIQGKKELLEETNKKIEDEKSMTDSLGDSKARIKQYEEDKLNIQNEINNAIREQQKLEEDIVTGKGRTAKLTNTEMKMLDELQNKISARSISVGKLKLEQERLLSIENRSEVQNKRLFEVQKDLNREHGLLVDSQRKYNKILSDASSLNPFIVFIRAMRQFLQSDMVKKSIQVIADIVTDLFQFISDELIPRLNEAIGVLFSVLRNGSTGTLNPIFKLVKSLGGLAGDILKYTLDGFYELFSYISKDDSLKNTGSNIEKIADIVEKIRTKIKPFLENLGIWLIKVYDIVKNIITTVGPAVVNLALSIGNLFSAVLGAIGKLLGYVFKDKGIGFLEMFANAINYVSELINGLADWISDLPVEKIRDLAAAFLSVYVALKLISGLNAAVLGIANSFSIMHGNAKKLNKVFDSIFDRKNPTSFINLLDAIGLSIMGNIKKTILWTAAQNALNQAKRAGSVIYSLPGMKLGNKGFTKIGNIGKNIPKNMGKAWEGAFSGAWLQLGLFSEKLGKVGSKGGIVSKMLGGLLSPLTAATGVMSSLSGLMAVIPAIIAAILAAIGPVIVIIMVIGTLVAGIFVAFKNNIGGFRDKIMEFVGSVMEWIGKIAAKGAVLFEKIITMFMSLGTLCSPIIADILVYVTALFKKITDFIFGIVDNVIDVVGGIVDFITGIASGNKQLILSGIIDIVEGIIQAVIKVVGFMFGLGTQIASAIYGSAISIVKWLVDLILGAVGKIPGLGEILGLGEEGKTKEAIDSVFESMKQEVDSVPQAIEKAEKVAAGFIGGVGDKLRESIGVKSKAEQEADAQAKRQERIIERQKKREELKKQKEAEAKKYEEQKITDLKDGLDRNTDSNKDLSSKLDRPNVTNNTYVEYRAAEDDEVNRRMIERVMNNILKADIGLMMGDTAGMSTD